MANSTIKNRDELTKQIDKSNSSLESINEKMKIFSTGNEEKINRLTNAWDSFRSSIEMVK